MKKNFFMIMMLSLVFLGLGNVSFGQTLCSDCDSIGSQAKNACLLETPTPQASCADEGEAALSSCESNCQDCPAGQTSLGDNDGVPICCNPGYVDESPALHGGQMCTAHHRDCGANKDMDVSYINCATPAGNTGVDCGDGTICPNVSACDCVDNPDGTVSCDACKNTAGPTNVIDDGNGEDIVLDTPCDVATSNLNGDTNAIVSIPSVSCTCKKGFGESTSQVKPHLCQPCTNDDVCCGTKLNTKIPFIGNCIETTTQNPNSTINETTAFPVLVSSLVKILISVILIASFVLIVVAGVRIATGDAKGGKDMIVKVAIGLAILGASGVILRLINPNFFG